MTSLNWPDFVIEKLKAQQEAQNYDIINRNNYPDTAPGNEISAVPLVLVADLRHFWGRTGANTGVTDTVYTVPAGYRYYVEQVFKKEDANVANQPYLYFEDSSGNQIIRFKTDGVQYELNNQLPQKVKLVAGDIIKAYYKTADAAGACSFTIIGTLEIETAQMRSQ